MRAPSPAVAGSGHVRGGAVGCTPSAVPCLPPRSVCRAHTHTPSRVAWLAVSGLLFTRPSVFLHRLPCRT
ncbi:hypothetical protein EON66_09680 [archaeon]|nr:MAG: hypothetical protein EON66_09680 [archaeon]